MKKLLFAIFAHPDDEAFGPAATLLQESDAGTELHLILLTAGENGHNDAGHDDLAAVRLTEWRTSGKLLGAAAQEYWNYRDGQLNNADMIEIAQRLEDYITKTATTADEIELMSFELGGLSGHIDHIVAARAAAQTFYKLRAQQRPVTRLRLFCLPNKLRPETDSSWIYAEAGCRQSDIDQVVDTRPQLLSRIEAVMAAHASQASDAAYVKQMLGDQLGVNWFKIID